MGLAQSMQDLDFLIPGADFLIPGANNNNNNRCDL